MKYKEFWPLYLRAHSKRLNRFLHYVGSSLALLVVGYYVSLGQYWGALWAPAVGYAFAWLGHFAVERNRPATFGHPFFSLFSDFRMLALALSGRLGSHLKRALN